MGGTEKESKILTCNNIKPPVDGRCGFFVKRKQRYCKMIPAKGNRFCAEHLCEDKDVKESEKRKRISCPLDSKHTVFEDNLEKHLKKCNATLKTKLPFYSENINLNIQDYVQSQEEKIPLYLVQPEELRVLISKIKECFNSCFDTDVSEDFSFHKVLDEELNKSVNGSSARKHLLQQASLLGILERSHALQDQKVFIEFGAGRGALSHWLQKTMVDKHKTKFLLVDRQHNRNKLDCYHKGADQGPTFERLNIDIQHLNLGNVHSLVNDDFQVTAVGKHLCGGATDLSLKCLMEASKSTELENCTKKQKQQFMVERIHSIVFALCCYHRCTWETYVGNQFMRNNKFSPLEFSRLVKMATWSTCGFERRIDKTDEGNSLENDDIHLDENHVDGQDVKLHHELGLTSEEQVQIGWMCKRLLDYGRILYLRNYGFECKLIKYIDENITPENISLVVTRPSTT